MSNYQADEQLLADLARNDGAAWQHFYQTNRERFKAFFLKYSGQSPEAVIQLYQEAMVTVHRQIVRGKLKPPLNSQLRTYLFGVGKMLCRSGARSKYSLTDEIPELAVAPEIIERTEREEQASLVRRLLAQLDETCRQIIEMVYLRDTPMQEVATALDLPSAGAARKRKFDCMQKLRKLVPDGFKP